MQKKKTTTPKHVNLVTKQVRNISAEEGGSNHIIYYITEKNENK